MYQPTNAPSMLFALEPRLLLSADIVALTIEAAIADSTPPPPPPPENKRPYPARPLRALTYGPEQRP